ncbi:ribonuclease E/G [Caulobacter mirabilis]|uniref:RNA-binding protein n=1 Tax=Caulobacter mirabilis TaxID=69666 RepID=A0A2D2B019_9CAUL|nr:ribonuclease E/G [Caulobacter mirabilis]ATQ43527.1 RNA-binding protein [Caulobacter mirabilis]
MSRKFFLDKGIGETRAVITVDGRPERLLIDRHDAPAATALGARSVARVRSVEKNIGVAFLDLPGKVEALYSLRHDEPPPVRGAAVEVEIRTEARQDKLATVRLIGPAEGEPRLLEGAPDVEAELLVLAKGSKIVEGLGAREAADAAEAEALMTVHPLPGGGDIAIEPTRALVSVDVDLGGRPGSDTKSAARSANLAALAIGARLLRLKGLGGLVIFDLVGRGHDGKAIDGAARAAFAPDNPGVAIDKISRFGTLTLTVPRRRRPVLDVLCDERGVPTPQTMALRLVRALEREGRALPGGRLTATCAPAVLAAFEPRRAALTDRLGARFVVEAREGFPVDQLDVVAR